MILKRIFQCRVGTTWCPLGTFGPSITVLDGSNLKKESDRVRGERERELGRPKMHWTAQMCQADTTWDISAQHPKISRSLDFGVREIVVAVVDRGTYI